MRAFWAALPPRSVSDDAGVVAEGGLELVVGLLAQFVPVAQEQAPAWAAARPVQTPEQVGGDDRLARARGQRQQYPAVPCLLAVQNDFSKAARMAAS